LAKRHVLLAFFTVFQN